MFVKIKYNSFFTRAKVLDYFFGRVKGLMFSSKLRNNESVLLKFAKEGYCAIHMLFVFQSIDAVWLDKNNRIVALKRGIRPFTLYVNPGRKASAILETRENATRNLKIGDRLKVYK